jgi:hypothetical protein
VRPLTLLAGLALIGCGSDSSSPDGASPDLAASDRALPDLSAADLAAIDRAPSDLAPSDLAPPDLAPSDLALRDQSTADLVAVGPRLYGYSMHILSQPDPDPYVTLAVQSNAAVGRDDVSWSSIEKVKGTLDWSGPDALVTHAAKQGLRLLLIVDTTPAWSSGQSTNTSSWWWYPPGSAADYGAFAGKVAARYGATGTFWAANPTVPKVLPVGIEVWNEPNNVGFWQSGPDPVKYTAMLKSAYAAVKAADPTMPVIAGALSPHGGYDDANCDGVADSGSDASGTNPLNFLQTMYGSGAAGSFDALSHHPYNFSNGATAAQMLAYHPCNAWSQMNGTTPSLRSLMSANGDGAKRIWATELGAPTCITNATYTCVSEAEQANLATMELALWQGWTWSGDYFWYDLRDDGGGTSLTDREQHFGAVRGDNSLKPSYAALKAGY